MKIVLTFYDEIEDGHAEQVLAQLRSEPAADVDVRINSPGGSVSAGLAIFNALKPRKPTVYIDGVAASIASLIAMAGARIIAAENALVMIHDPWASTQGNAAELRRTAEILDKHRDAMLSAYARSGLARKDLLTLLAAETWMSAEEALALGFVDEVAEALRYAAHAPASFAGYYNTPKELLMDPKKKRGAVGGDPQVPNPSASTETPSSPAPTPNATEVLIAALRDRNVTMTAMVAPYIDTNQDIRNYTLQALADPAITTAAFGQQVLALLGRDCAPIAGVVTVDGYGNTLLNGRPSSDMRVSGGHADGGDFVQATSDALAIRAGIKVEKPHAGARDVQGMSLSDIMQACVRRSGRSVVGFGDRSRGGLVRAALSTSDFPAILENSLNKALRGGFEAEPATFEAWTRKVLVPDFKPQSRPILGSAPDLLKVVEGAEYTFGALDEDKAVPYSVGKFGRLVRLTWEAMVNDDLGAFLRMTQALGQAAARAEGDAVYATFAENSGAGPTMQDTVPLFHATHGNLATSASTIDADSLGAARVLLRRQTALGGGVLNLTPRYLLVAPEHEQAAETLLAAAARSMSQGADNALVPAWLAKLELVVEARLDGGAFYVLTGAESIDTLERAWLEADNGPVVSEEDGFYDDAKAFKVRHVFGGRWLDWRGAVKVPIT
ncbi:head maturation protease, ClpP-related [Lysobacter sp. CFH 32150]|uniref:head maturation protease, ClpP-related n=1 Tax=Lysobacter sp. CFH 32150 TaxID=2927128 RepID=UPI001FA77F42|nr:head maturation protease, ClpP-related [Lysobacter sp. CFH 32150]MCI4566383.1 Clp protease ClpP [Lysobacter sp. CFH 32150]